MGGLNRSSQILGADERGALQTKGVTLEARFSKKDPTWPKRKKVVGRPWTKDDLRTLKSMAKDKQGVTKIAKALKRTIGATSVMAAKRGVSLSARG
jgi:hypothetical protein